MFGAVIYDNWGFAFGMIFLLAAFTTSVAVLSKLVLVAIVTLIIVMSFTNNLFVFQSVPEEEKTNKENK